MNKDGNIKGKFNVIDLLVIILAVVVVIGIFMRFGSNITTAVKSDEEFIYTIRIENVKSYTVDALKMGGKVTDKNSNMDLGEILDVSVENAKKQEECADGRVVNALQPERYTATVTVKTHGKESDNSYITADSNELSVGRKSDFYTKYVHTSGNIMSVEKVEK